MLQPHSLTSFYSSDFTTTPSGKLNMWYKDHFHFLFPSFFLNHANHPVVLKNTILADPSYPVWICLLTYSNSSISLLNYTIPISQQEEKQSPFILQKFVFTVLYSVPSTSVGMLGVHSFAIEYNPNFAYLYPSTTQVIPWINGSCDYLVTIMLCHHIPNSTLPMKLTK